MHRIDLKAVVIAFAIECVLDQIIGNILLFVIGQDVFTPEMDHDAFIKAATPIVASADFLLASAVLGTLTTVAGGYLAARFAKGFPLYNGLAIGIVGFVFTAFTLDSEPAWYMAVGLLLSIPASIYGASIAKKRMAAVQ